MKKIKYVLDYYADEDAFEKFDVSTSEYFEKKEDAINSLHHTIQKMDYKGRNAFADRYGNWYEISKVIN